MNKKDLYVVIQIIMISVMLGTAVQIITELTNEDVGGLKESVNVDQIVLYIFLIIGSLFVAVVFNGKASKITEGLGGKIGN